MYKFFVMGADVDQQSFPQRLCAMANERYVADGRMWNADIRLAKQSSVYHIHSHPMTTTLSHSHRHL